MALAVGFVKSHITDAADTAKVREDLERDVTKVRFTQRGYQAQLEDSVQTEYRGLAMVDASRALQSRCRRQIEECAEAIGSLQDEIAALVPEPREGE